MKNLFVIALLTLSCLFCNAQDSAYRDHSGLYHMIFHSERKQRGVVMITTSDGVLYRKGITIWKRRNEVILNGRHLEPGQYQININDLFIFSITKQ